MNILIKLATTTFFGIALMPSSSASNRGIKQETVMPVQKAVAYFKANGKKKAFAEINKIESKTVYVEPVGGLGFAVGVYNP